MFTKKFIVGAFAAAILATPALSACGHTGHSAAPVPAAVPTEQPPAAVSDSGTGNSWNNGTSGMAATSDGSDDDSTGVPDSSWNNGANDGSDADSTGVPDSTSAGSGSDGSMPYEGPATGKSCFDPSVTDLVGCGDHSGGYSYTPLDPHSDPDLGQIREMQKDGA
jgi:hypothetical protein